MGGLEAVITGLEDEFKFARRLSRGQLTGLVIVSSFLPALISCTQGGAYTLFWFDIYSAGVSLLFSALFETIGVVYCYGLDKFIPNIESMLGRKPPLFYIVCWKYISPIFLGVSSSRNKEELNFSLSLSLSPVSPNLLACKPNNEHSHRALYLCRFIPPECPPTGDTHFHFGLSYWAGVWPSPRWQPFQLWPSGTGVDDG